MKPLTLTPNDARNLTIPATEELLRGWVGPVVVLQDPRHWTYTGRRRDEHYIVPPTWEQHDIVCGDDGLVLDSVRLPLSRPEVIDRLYRVFAAGVRCPHGVACPGLHPETACTTCPSGFSGCDGYLRPPTDLHFRGVKADGWGPELEAALLYLSWVRMAGGSGPIDGVLGPRYSVSPVEIGRDVLFGRCAGGGPGTGMSALLSTHPHHDNQHRIDWHERFQMTAESRALLNDDGTITAEVPDALQ